MHSKDAIRATMNLSDMVFQGYLEDLDDTECLMRPAVGCNHAAWQFGHLIASEVDLLGSVCPDAAPTLPDGFAEQHAKDKADVDDAAQFRDKAEYLRSFQAVRRATLEALEALPEERLDEPAPEQMRAFCPTVGHVFVLIATHPMMHAGQLVPLRRKLGKPVKF